MVVKPPPDAGLCGSCAHARVVTGARSTFVRCGLSETDPRFPRYPPLPVLRCDGYVNASAQATRL